MDEQLSELEKLQQAAQLIEEMSQGRLQVCPSVVGQVYIRPQHDSNLGMDMRIDSIPGQPHYRITFTVQLRRMGTDMVADDLRALLSEVGQTYRWDHFYPSALPHYTVLEVDCYEEVPCNEKDCAHHRWRDPAPDGGRHSSAPVEAEQKGQIGPGVMPGLSDPT